MKPTRIAGIVFAALLAVASAAASAQPILYTFTGLRGTVDTCKWFDDYLNVDRSEGAMARQVDLLYNRIALPVDANVTVGASATSAGGAQLVDYKLGSVTVCSTAEVIYGPTPEPSATPTPMST